jgi:hypothetical protein
LPPHNEMATTTFEFRTLTATLVFDLTDAFATTRGTRGPFPRPIEPIRIFATERVTPNPVVFNPPLQLRVQRNGIGFHVFHNSMKRPDGTVVKKALINGEYNFRIEGDFYQAAVLPGVVVPSPRRAAAFSLLPAYNYPFPLELKPTGGRGFALLRGSLHTREGAPLAGATISVAPEVGASNAYITGDDGQWVLVFSDLFFPGVTTTRNISVVVTPDGGPAINIPNVTVDKGTERSLSETALRGWVLARGIGVAGATVEVQGQPGQVRTATDGSWTYYFNIDHSLALSVDVTARLPNGSTQTQINQQVQPRATVIVPPFEFP